MPALKNAVQGFKTGDLVITYLPRGGTRPMHVTIYLEPADSPSNTHAFIHAAPDGVVIEGIEAWREMPKYRHARRGGELAGEAAEAAKVWASDRTIQNNTPTTTPYGSYPGAKESATSQLRANRFSAMMQTASVATIPLEAAGLVRLMKWDVSSEHACAVERQSRYHLCSLLLGMSSGCRDETLFARAGRPEQA